MPNLNYGGGKANKRLNRLDRGAPGGFQAVSRGTTRFLGPNSWRLEGSGFVTGILSGIGEFIWSGFLNLTGNITSTGIFNQNGPWNLAGTGGITGDVNSTGNWIQTGTYTVGPGGEIIIQGSTTIELSAAGGAATLKFGDGPRVWSDGAAARMDSGPGTGIVVATSIAAILRSPNTSQAVAASNSGVLITGNMLSDLPLKAGAAVNVHVDLNGKFWRTS